MKLAFVTLSPEGVRLLRILQPTFAEADYFIHEKVDTDFPATRFPRVMALMEQAFPAYDGIICIAPTGAVVRAMAKHIDHKTKDPAVVQMDVGGRWVISLLSGHEGGANNLALKVANVVGAEPIITTSNDASKRFIVGVGCRKGKPASEIEAAIKDALGGANVPLAEVRYITSADVKSKEAGLIEAAERLSVPLLFIASEIIRGSSLAFEKSDFVQKSVNLPAVAEPAALLAGRRTEIICPKKAYNGITVAIARENCLSLG